MKIAISIYIGAMLLGISSLGQAVAISPISYDMLNGNTGSYNYWDDSYSGAGNNTQDNAFLSGGLGDLTDGVIAAQNWYIVEPPLGPHGPYIGWFNINPTINFHFGSLTHIDSITIYADDSNGAGGVFAPSSIAIGSEVRSVFDPVSADPLAITFSGLGLSVTDLDITIIRNGGWVFVSEITFEGTSVVPVPAAVWLFGSGLLGLVGVARRKNNH